MKAVRPGSTQRALHVVVLWCFACAQPLFDVLVHTPTFFAARDLRAADVWILVTGLALGLPATLALTSALVARAHGEIGWWLHLSLVGALCTLIALPPLGTALPTIALPAAALLGLAAAGLYQRGSLLPSLLSAGAIAPPVFVALFLLDSDVAAVRAADAVEAPLADLGARGPVVFVVLDELPLGSLLDTTGAIDAKLFPNFAALASRSTWFRNASAVHVDTAENLIAIATGMRPGDRPGLPLARAHPRSLFSLLRGSHRLLVRETVTRLLPGREEAPRPIAARTRALALDLAVVYAHLVLPEPLREHLPPLEGRWQGFWSGAADRAPHPNRGIEPDLRGAGFRRFVAQLDGRRPRSLYFLHSMLPHTPFVYLPSGTYVAGDRRFVANWGEGEWPTSLALQRHLLQLGFTDRLLGELLERLEAEHLYDPVTLVVVSDHGVSFRPGHSARHLEAGNAEDLLRVACFVKRPFQRRGTIDDRNFEHPDLLPTIADALRIELPWAVDGRSGFADPPETRPLKRIRDHAQAEWQFDAAPPARLHLVERRARLFGPSPDWPDVYAMGPRPDLVGRAWRGLPSGSPSGVTARVEHLDLLAHVDPRAEQQPHLIKGQLVAGSDPHPHQVALAIGGRLRAVTYTFARDAESAAFEAVLPPESLRAGSNELRVFGVADDGALRAIALEAIAPEPRS